MLIRYNARKVYLPEWKLSSYSKNLPLYVRDGRLTKTTTEELNWLLKITLFHRSSAQFSGKEEKPRTKPTSTSTCTSAEMNCRLTSTNRLIS